MPIRVFPLLFAACIWPYQAAHAAEAQPGNPNYQETRHCSEQDFVVWGEFEDLRVLRGENDWTEIEDELVIMFCGDFDEEYLECPLDSRYVWVTRSGEFEVFLACYYD